MPFWFLPKEVGLKGAVYADAGGLYDYKGPTSWAFTNEVNVPGCIPGTTIPLTGRIPAPDWSMTTAMSSAPRSVSA